jgi:hypothetical protein
MAHDIDDGGSAEGVSAAHHADGARTPRLAKR